MNHGTPASVPPEHRTALLIALILVAAVLAVYCYLWLRGLSAAQRGRLLLQDE